MGGGVWVVVDGAISARTALFSAARPSIMGHADISSVVVSTVLYIVNTNTFTASLGVKSSSSAVDVILVTNKAVLFL